MHQTKFSIKDNFCEELSDMRLENSFNVYCIINKRNNK